MVLDYVLESWGIGLLGCVCMFGVGLYWGFGFWLKLIPRGMNSDFDDMQVLGNQNALKIGGLLAIAPVSSIAQIFEPCIVIAETHQSMGLKRHKGFKSSKLLPNSVPISCIFFEITSSLPGIYNPKQATSSG